MANTIAPEWWRFLEDQRVARLATVTPRGLPHLTPLWYVVLDEAIYLGTQEKRKKARNIAQNNAVSFCVDVGRFEWEYQGIIVEGRADPVTDAATLNRYHSALIGRYFRDADDPGYQRISRMPAGRVLRIESTKVLTWDFTHLAAKRDPAGPRVKMTLIYHALGEGATFDEDRYHRDIVGPAIRFIGTKGARRMELTKVLPADLPEHAKPPTAHRMTEIWFDSLDEARTCMAAIGEMLYADPDARHFHTTTTERFYSEVEQYDFDTRGNLSAVRGRFADRYRDRLHP